MDDCPKSDRRIRGRDSSPGNVWCFHVMCVLHLLSWYGSSWLRSQMDFILVPSENPALNTNLFLLMNPSFPNSTSPSKNPIPRMELHALTTGITNKGWSTSSSVCFFVLFMTRGLPGGHYCQELWVLSWWRHDIQRPDPWSHMVGLLDHCCQNSWALLRLGMGCVCLDFKVRNSLIQSLRCDKKRGRGWACVHLSLQNP